MTEPKFTRDPVTGQNAVEICGRTIVLKTNVKTPEQALNAPMSDVVECGL